MRRLNMSSGFVDYVAVSMLGEGLARVSLAMISASLDPDSLPIMVGPHDRKRKIFEESRYQGVPKRLGRRCFSLNVCNDPASCIHGPIHCFLTHWFTFEPPANVWY